MSLDKKSRILTSLEFFEKEFREGRIVSERKYQRKLIIESLKYFKEEIKKLKVKKYTTEYKSVFIILPANVATEFLEFIPLIISYDIDFFLKLPKRNRKFIGRFFDLLSLENVKAEYLSHEETIKRAKKFDFIVASGSSDLENILKEIGKPYQFFGPKFSFALMENYNKKDIKNILKDFLSYDTEGCLSVRFLFIKTDLMLEDLNSLIDETSRDFYPQIDFDEKLFEYYNLVNLYYSQEYLLRKKEAIIKVNEFPLYFPQRTLFVFKYNSFTEIIDFLKESRNSVQAIITKDGKEIDFFKKNTSVSLFLPYGKAQFPPLGWFFERKLNVSNFFNHKS